MPKGSGRSLMMMPRAEVVAAAATRACPAIPYHRRRMKGPDRTEGHEHAAGEALSVKKAPHRPRHRPAHGLRAEWVAVAIMEQTTIAKEIRHVVSLFVRPSEGEVLTAQGRPPASGDSPSGSGKARRPSRA